LTGEPQHIAGIIIAIDGHSSCGKSTLARKLAEKLGYTYIDSGAMYRAVTLYAHSNNLVGSDFIYPEKLISALPEIEVGFRQGDDYRPRTILNGVDVEEKIRSLEVSQLVSRVSTICEVRRHLVKLQRKLAEHGGIVMDGRDIGTVVFPDAQLKIFLTATAEIRAQRRFKELSHNGEQVSFDEVLQNVITRDEIDSTRSESPLRQADDAVLLDNSLLNAEETLSRALQLAQEVLKSLKTPGNDS